VTSTAPSYDPQPVTDRVPGSIHPLTGGRFEAQCGKCLKPSVPVATVDAAQAWDELQRVGWTLHNAYALCPACTKDPPNVDKDAAEARRRRKRR
jgi:hypothetical protein